MLHLRGHTRCVRCLAYSPDGRMIASGSDDRRVRVWDRGTGRQTMRLRGKDAIRALLFSPDGKHLAAATWEEAVLWWALGKRQGMRLRTPDGGRVWSLAIAPDGSRLIAGTLSGWIYTIAAPRSGGINRGTEAHSWPISAIAFAPTNRMFATGSHDRTIRLWEVVFPPESIALFRHSDWVRCLAFSPDGRILASGGDDLVIRLWDVQQRQQIAVLHGHTKWVRQVAFTPDGRTLLSAGWDETVRVWDVASGQQREAFDWKIGRVHALAVAPDGMTAAAGGDHHVIVVWDLD